MLFVILHSQFRLYDWPERQKLEITIGQLEGKADKRCVLLENVNKVNTDVIYFIMDLLDFSLSNSY